MKFSLSIFKVAIVAVLVLLLSVAPVAANPNITERREEARRVKAQLDELDRQLALAAEDHNEARVVHSDLVRKIEDTRKALAETNARIEQLQTVLSKSTDSMYRAGPLNFVEVLLSTDDLGELSATWEMLREISRQEAKNVAQLKEERIKAQRYETELVAKEAEAKAVVQTMESRRATIESKLNERRRMLTGIEAEIAALEREEEARALAVLRASVARSTAEPGGRRFPPPTRAPRSEVVNIAKRYLGAPYRWGAEGPNSFDCSGFTQFVFRQVGVSLPRVSRQQIRVGERVSRDDLQPGDLVFFGRPIHHVGIYVGGGRYIHAPRTGDVVSIDPLTRRDFVGASRP